MPGRASVTPTGRPRPIGSARSIRWAAPPTPSSAGSMNSASAAIAMAPARTASLGNPGTAGQTRQAGPRLDRPDRPRSGASPPRRVRGWRRRSAAWARAVAPVAGSAADSRPSVAADAAGRPWTRPARSSSAELAAAPRARRGPRCRHRPQRQAPGPPASRSAALPASPWPSTARLASRSAARRGTGTGSRSSGQGPRHRSPTAGAPPSHAAGCGAPVDRPLRGAAARRRRCRPRRRSAQATAPRSARSPVARRRHACGPPRASPSPGTSGRPGTRWTGSRPPGARRRAGPVATRRSSDGGGRGSSNVRRGRRQRRRMDRPGHRPCWAALAQSSRG